MLGIVHHAVLFFLVMCTVSVYGDYNGLKSCRFAKLAGKTASSSLLALSLLAPGLANMQSASAFGPVEMTEFKINSYKSVELCNGQKPLMPGQKAMEGLFPVCIEVDIDVSSPSKEELKDVSIYGFVKEDSAGNSVLPNNPDFKSDAGQYAMIKKLNPGKNHAIFQFVAAISVDPKKEQIPTLTFMKTKAISFPGGAKFAALSECEMDPRNCFEGEMDDDE